jgi:DNA invertase Pin-like site-specific DNA recombinase
VGVRAAIYTRISSDDEDDRLGVGRQEQDCRALCERKGWSVVGVYEDNDRSAFSGKTRERYNDLLDDTKGGALDVIVCWHPDRLHRSPKELEHFIDVLEVAQVTVATVTAGDRDFATPDGRFMARIEGTIARRESEHKSVRIKRKHQQLVEGGTFVSGRRPFGYEFTRTPEGKRDRLKAVTAEAVLVQEAARRVLAGESLYAVVADWNARGVPTVTGAAWNTKTLSQILTSGRIAGWRDHQGEPVTRSDQWEPIVDEATWKRLRAILLDPARKRTRVARRYLLGQGLLRCGVCGSKLVATPQRNAAGQLVPRYGCRKEKGGCGKVSILAEPVDDIVSDLVVEALCDPGILAKLQSEASPTEEMQRRTVADLEASLEELSRDYYAEKAITRAEYVAARSVLVPRLDHARAELAKATKRQPALLSGLDDLRAQWGSLGLDRRRALIEFALESVTIASANRRGVAGFFDASRVQAPVWRF